MLSFVKNETMQEVEIEREKKSAFKAAMFSAVVPGAGEIYAESYIKGAIFALVEVAAWATYFTYNSKGDDKDKEMREFGDENWSERRYWAKVYMVAVMEDDWNDDPLSYDENGLSEADYTTENIERLRQLENSFPTQYGFTHSLPETKTQQYYEMIYKYPIQFGAGWVEVGTNWQRYDNYSPGDPVESDLRFYRDLRNKSNSFYDTANTMATVVMINHLASAIDAAFTVRSFNRKIDFALKAKSQKYNGERVTMVGFNVAW